MLTRQSIVREADPGMPAPVNMPGAIVERPIGAANSNKNIVAAMAIARPNSSPSTQDAPFYRGPAYRNPQYAMVRGGALRLIPSAPKMAMDPSDASTYQREYRFT